MRTTLTLDEDVAIRVRQLQKEQHAGLKQVVNEVMRRGLSRVNLVREPKAVYRTRSVSLGRCLLGNVDAVSDTLAIAEGENYR